MRSPRNPPVEDDLHLKSLFGCISGDEDRDEADLLSSPQAGPVNPQTPEPIEIDDVELEIHPSQAEQLIAVTLPLPNLSTFDLFFSFNIS